MARFFIVFSPDGPTPPVKAHETHKRAFHAAHMMAKAHPGQTFHVMQSASKPIACAPAEIEETA
jgi:hypothetical protein